MEGLVSPTNHLKLWGTSQNGSIYRSLNGGNSYSGLPKPSNGQWVTPLWIHPTNEDIVYGGWTGVYKSTTGGTAWTNISGATITTTLADLAVSQSNPNYIYASDGSTLYVTTDDGTTWATRNAPATINDICIDPTDPNKIWVALNSTTNRVMVSTDAGATFTNVSAGLPAITARTIVVDDNTPRGMYVGMNIGVYYKVEPDANWGNFSDNLPLVAINELEIQKAAGKIRVATYGRGVWESPVANIPPPSGFTFNNPAPAVATCPTPNTMSITLGTNAVGGFTNPITLTATAGVPVGTTISFGTNPVTPGNSSVVSLNNANTLGTGSYIITITGTATGATTQTRNITYTINSGTGPTISTQPVNQNACVGSNATFTVAATGASYQWQVSIDGGATWNNIPTATAATLTLPLVTAPLNNTQYRCIATNTCGSTTSNVAILTVSPATAITSNPVGETVCVGSSASFCVTASGNNLTYQWEVATSCTAPFTNIAGATSACLNITNAVATAVYRCKVTGSCGTTITSTCAQLTVGALATVTEQPTNKEICTYGNTSFVIEGSSTFPITYQWQVSNDGGTTWNNISGATSTILTLSNIAITQNNSRYRCQLFTTACPTPANSNAALLTVRALPTVGLIASPLTSLLPGQSTVLQATPSLPNAGSTISKIWLKDGAPFVYAGNLYAANVEKVGSYQVSISETFSSGLTCSNLSPIVTLKAPRSDKLFIFPIPNDGRFTVSYYNVTLTNSSRSITVYDAKGSKVYYKQMPINGPYTLLNVDIKPAQGGVYIVVVDDEKGIRLAQGKIVVK
jgi:Sortilin, neurotensin receptor 3,